MTSETTASIAWALICPEIERVRNADGAIPLHGEVADMAAVEDDSAA